MTEKVVIFKEDRFSSRTYDEAWALLIDWVRTCPPTYPDDPEETR